MEATFNPKKNYGRYTFNPKKKLRKLHYDVKERSKRMYIGLIYKLIKHPRALSMLLYTSDTAGALQTRYVQRKLEVYHGKLFVIMLV